MMNNQSSEMVSDLKSGLASEQNLGSQALNGYPELHTESRESMTGDKSGVACGKAGVIKNTMVCFLVDRVHALPGRLERKAVENEERGLKPEENATSFRGESYEVGINDSGSRSILEAVNAENVVKIEEHLQAGSDVNTVDENGASCLHYAVHRDRADIVSFLAAKGADPNKRDLTTGGTPVHWAVRANKLDCLKALQSAGGDITLENRGKAPIHMASMLGLVGITRFLLANGASANVLCSRKLPPLHYGVTSGDVETVRALLDSGADVNYSDVMAVAVCMGQPRIVSALLRSGARADVQCGALKLLPVHWAAASNNTHVMEVLARAGADLSAPSCTTGDRPVHVATRAGNLATLKYLQWKGVPLNSTNRLGVTALHLAAVSGDVEICKLLIRSGAAVNAQALRFDLVTPLHLALVNKNTGVAKLLVESGANLHAKDKRNATPVHIAVEKHMQGISSKLSDVEGPDVDPLIHWAAKWNNVSALEWLINKGAELESKDRFGLTALHAAALRGHVEAMKILLRRNVDVNCLSSHGETPLYLAVQENKNDAVSLLLSWGADVNMKTRDGYEAVHIAAIKGNVSFLESVKDFSECRAQTRAGELPFHCAALEGNVPVLEWLLQHGHPVDARDNFGCTPLIHAVHEGHYSAAELLLSEGADVSARPSTGDRMTSLHIAAAAGREELVQLLLDHGAVVDIPTDNSMRTPLLCAVSRGHVEVVKLLAQHRADMNRRDRHGLCAADMAWLRRDERTLAYLQYHAQIHNSLYNNKQE